MPRIVNYTLQSVTEDDWTHFVATKHPDGTIHATATFQIVDENAAPRQVESTSKALSTPQRAQLRNIIRDFHVDDLNAEQNL